MASTPLMQQYQAIKERHGDALLFFRLGDFYELFGEDAKLAARLLEITLTSRDGVVPMCGVPYHAVESYLARLIRLGYRVAICEQMEDPKAVKGIVRREVVRVVTPGTLVEARLLEDGQPNYLVALKDLGNGRVAVALAEASTGELALRTFAGEEALQEELARLRPVERVTDEIGMRRWPEVYRAPHAGRERLPLTIAQIDPGEAEALEILCGHLSVTCPQLGALFRHLGPWPGVTDMELGSETLRHLEILERMDGSAGAGTLLNLLDECRTAPGRRLLRRWLQRPLGRREAIRIRHEAVEELLSQVLRQKLRDRLQAARDMERLLGRMVLRAQVPLLLVQLRETLLALPGLAELLQPAVSQRLSQLRAALPDLADLAQQLVQALHESPATSAVDGTVVRPGFRAEIDRVTALASDTRAVLMDFEQQERERTGIRGLKVGYNKVFGYYFEVPRAQKALVPPEWHAKQTLVGSERYSSDWLQVKEREILAAEDERVHLEQAVLDALVAAVLERAPEIQIAAKVVAELDVLAGLAECAQRYGYVRPQMTDSTQIRLEDARHPVVERLLPPGTFVANDVALDRDRRLLVVTGPNMGGKSTYLRQVGLLVIMAQMGSFVPARSACIGVVDRVFTRIGASDDLGGGRSTFFVEMEEVASMLARASAHSLVLLDEVGRGTSTFDGLSLAWAILEHLHDETACLGLMATHYHELIDLAERLPHAANASMQVREHERGVAFLHRVGPGGADKSYGLEVARRAGLPARLLVRAQEVLMGLDLRTDAVQETAAALPPADRKIHPLLDELEGLELDDLTPREALTRLYGLRERARKARVRGGDGGGV